MDEQTNNETVKEEIGNSIGTTYKGKTCFIQRPDRIKVKVEVGFNISATMDFRVSNLKWKNLPEDGNYNEALKSDVENLKSCLVVLIGGHHLLLKEIDKVRSGVYPAIIYAQCNGIPEGVPYIKVRNKIWFDVGYYLSKLYGRCGFDPEVVKQDLRTWREK